MLSKKTLLLWLLIATFNATCEEGCVRCGPDNKCQTCDIRLGWKLVGDSCQRNVDTKCILNGAMDSCLLCNQNFFYDSVQRKCVRSSRRLEKCIHMQDNALCDVCITGYYPLDGVCTKLENPIENCKYQRDAERCLQCEEEYWPTSNFKKCINNPNTQQIEGCKFYSNLYCNQCKDNTVPNYNNYIYTLFSGIDVKKYQRFVQNQQLQFSDNLIDAQCEDVKVQFCKVYKSAIECAVCNNGYYLKQGKCIVNPFTIIDNCLVYSSSNKCQKCAPQFYPHDDNKECRKAEILIDNCQVRNLNNCLQCFENYYLASNKCQQQVNIDNCETYSTTSATCVKCIDNFQLTSDNKKCLPAVSNCKTYASSNVNDQSLTCTACTNSTYLDSNNQCASGGVVNCLEYQTNGQQCQLCINGYYLAGNQCLAHTKILNCDLYSTSIKDTCTRCVTDHFLFTLEKICLGAFEVLHCVSYSSKDKCQECQQKYFLENNQCKLIPVEEHCLKRGVAGTDCQLCEEGYYLNTSATPKVCVKFFEQQTHGCHQQATEGHNDRHVCKVCKGSHYFVKISEQSTQTKFEGNICGLIDRIPTAQQIANCSAYILDSNTWKCLRCENGYYLSDSTNLNASFASTNKYGDTCSQTCATTIVALTVDSRVVSVNGLTTIDQLNDFSTNKCQTMTAPNDNCEYFVPTNATGATIFNYKCGKQKSTSNLIPKINYEPGQESSYGFNNQFSLPNNHGYASPTYTLQSITLNLKYPTNGDKCDSWNANPSGNNNSYCNKCSQQFSSKAQVQNTTSLTTQKQTSYLDCSVQIPDCETDILGGFVYDYRTYLRHKVNPMHVSCHSCSNTNQIPFIHLPLDNNAQWTDQWYQPFKVEENTLNPKDSPVKDGLVTQCREPTQQGLVIAQANFTRQFPNNCGMGLYNVSIDKTFKDTDDIKQVSVYCLACKPGYKAVYNADGFLSNCEEIAYCEKTTDKSVDKFVNACAKCQLGFNWSYEDGTKRILFDECIKQVVPNCIVSDGTNCKYCQKGYYLENAKTCSRLIVPKCVNYNYVDYKYHNVYKSGSTTDIEQSQISFALYLSVFNKGCLQCSSNYYQLYNYPVEQQQCVSSYNLLEQRFENSSHLIQNCALYEGNAVKKCHRCNSLYIPNSDNTKCISQANFFRCARVNEISTGKFECTDCEQGFYLVNKTCMRGTITNCTKYEPSTLPMKCIVCADKYRVSRDGKSCIMGNLPFCKVYENQFETTCNTCENNEHPLVNVDITNTKIKRCFRDLPSYNCQDVNTAKITDSVYYCDKCKQGYYQSNPDVNEPKNVCISISPITNCKTYDYVTDNKYHDRTHKCKECNAGYYVSEYGFSCKVRNPIVANCSVFVADSLKCQKCQDNFFLSDDKMICYENPTGVKNCEEYTSSTTCKRCANNYYLNNNKCLEVVKDKLLKGCVQYNEEQLCVECNQNFFFDSATNTCNVPNAVGCLTYTDINTCASCPKNTVFQEVQQGEVIIKNCVQYDLKFCLNIDSVTKMCKLCATNFYPQEDGTCDQANLIPNCLYYESKTECQQCENKFYRTADKKECFQTGFHLMNKFDQCKDVIYKDEQQCVACQEGMYFENQKCVKCKIENCLACNPREPSQCLICQSGYTQKDVNGSCEINLKDEIKLPNEDDGTDNENKTNVLVIYTLLLIALFN